MVREALVRYCKSGFHQLDGKSSLNGAAEAIKDATGVAIPQENLRRFINGKSKRSHEGKYSVPQGIDAIERFLIEDEFPLLSREDLESQAPPFQTPWRLSQYLRRGLEEEFLPVPPQIVGHYAGSFQNGTVEITLEFDEPEDDDGLLPAYEVFVDYGNTSGKERKKIKSAARSTGWAVWTPEDNLLVLMKHATFHKNHYYLTVGWDSELRDDAPFDNLILMRHDYPYAFPLALGAEQIDTETLIKQLKEELIVLRRLPGRKFLRE